MPISHEEAFKRGMISHKALHKLQGGGKSTISTRRGPGNPTKMADFSNKSKVDEYEPQDGPEATDKNQINTRATQKLGKVGTVSRGGRVGKTGSMSAGAINQGTGKSTSPGGKVTQQKRAIGVRGGGDTNDGYDGKEYYYGGGNGNRA